MIEQLTAQDFQNHKKRVIKFDPKISTIIGDTDAGKSALLRLLKWICLNVPGGDGFIREGARDAVGELVVDGQTIRRQRGKSGNLYFLDGSEFKAFGTNPPDAIANVLNVSPTNFQGQHDTVFWFGESAGEVSRQLNAVVDLGVIDESLANIAGRVAHFRQTAQICRERMVKAKAKKLELEWVVKADQEYVEIETLNDRLSQQTLRNAKLTATIQNIKKTAEQRQTAMQQAQEARVVGLLGRDLINLTKRRQELSQVVDSVLIQGRVISTGFPDVSRMAKLIDQWQMLKDERKQLIVQIESIKRQKNVVSAGVPDFSEVDRLAKSYSEVHQRRNGLQTLVQRLRNSLGNLSTSRQCLQQAQHEFDEETKGQVCPVCGKGME